MSPDAIRRSLVLAPALAVALAAVVSSSGAPAGGAPASPAREPSPGAVLKAGFAERDITPDIGMEAPGGYGKNYHRTFHDPCKVRVAVFDDGRKCVALVGMDLLFVTRHLTNEIRTQIEKRTGIPSGCVLVGATHSHSSGPIGMGEPGDYEGASPLVKELVNEKSIVSDPGYTARLIRQAVEAAAFACNARVEAKLAAGFGHENKAAFNRRMRMKNGLSYTHPGVGNPDIVGYAGPVDPQVGVVGVWDLQDAPLGVLVNFSCHATASPGGISANWIWAMEQTLRAAIGHAALPVLFLPGPCGDVTQVDNLAKFDRPAAEEWCRLVGGRVGAEAFKTLLLIRRGAIQDVPVDARQKIWKIRRRTPSPEKVKRALELVRKTPQEAGATEWTFAKETVMLDALMRSRPEVEVEVQAVQVGPVVFVTNPAEYFVQYGLDIKKGSRFPFTFPVQLANGIVGYVPTEDAFGPSGGGYETRLTSYSNLEISAGRQMADAGVALANTMTPGPLPQPPAPAPFKMPWGYGAVPPELE